MRTRLLMTALVLGALTPLAGGGLVTNSSRSAEYLRTLDRNSAVDNADIAGYNMAGTPSLKAGWTVNLSDQMVAPKETLETLGNPVVGNKGYRSDHGDLLVPNAYAAFRKKDWAVFLALETIGPMGVRDWKGGLPSLNLAAIQQAGYGRTGVSGVIADDAYAQAAAHGATPAQAQAAATAAGLGGQYFQAASSFRTASTWLAFRAGGALQVTPDFALAAALRYVNARQDLTASADGACSYDLYNHNLTDRTRSVIDATAQARGLSAEVGFDLRTAPDVLLTFTWELATKLNFRTSVRDGEDGSGLVVDGAQARLDLPQTVRLGLAWQRDPKTRLAFSLNTYREGGANLGLLGSPVYGGAAPRFGNTYEESATVERLVRPRWLVSFGLSCTQAGQNRSALVDTSPVGAQNNSLSEGAGFQYQYSDRLKLNAGLSHAAFLHPTRVTDAGDALLAASFAAKGVPAIPCKEYGREALTLAVGLNYHF